MVLVLCLNAAVDKTSAVKRLFLHRVNQLDEGLVLPGGKGINVARALRRLGGSPLVMGFTAGSTGRFIEAGLRRERLSARWIRLARGESRVCLSILNGVRRPTEINEPGPRVGPRDLARLFKAFEGALSSSKLVVLSGSLPPGCPPETYARLIRLARAAGKPALLDTSRQALRPALAAGPDFVKLNEEEAVSLGLKPRGGALALLRRRLAALGGRDGAITLGGDGALGFLGSRCYRFRAPRVASRSPIGCGDTYLAAVAFGMMRGDEPRRALAFATAVATASAKVLGAGVFRPADVPAILRRVTVAAAAG